MADPVLPVPRADDAAAHPPASQPIEAMPATPQPQAEAVAAALGALPADAQAEAVGRAVESIASTRQPAAAAAALGALPAEAQAEAVGTAVESMPPAQQPAAAAAALGALSRQEQERVFWGTLGAPDSRTQRSLWLIVTLTLAVVIVVFGGLAVVLIVLKLPADGPLVLATTALGGVVGLIATSPTSAK